MNIIACVKYIPDPEATVDKFSVDAAGMKMVPAQGVTSVVNPFDENAIEAALQLKEAHGGKVTVLSMGPPASVEALKRGTRMGADEPVLVDGSGLPDPNPQITAYILAKAIQKIGKYDLILCGRQAGDWDQGQVGVGIAEHLGIPCVTIVSKIEAKDSVLRVQRLVDDGYEILEVPMPAVLTLTSEINVPRLTSVAGILRTSTLKFPTWSRQDIGVDPATLESMSGLGLKSLFIPQFKAQCELMEGEPEEAATKLVQTLKANKVI